MAVRHLAGCVHVFHGQTASTAAIVRVLDCQQPRTWIVFVIFADRCLDRRQIQRAVGRGGQLTGMDAAQNCGAALFSQKDVSLIAQDHFVSSTTVAQDRGQVAHCAARHEHCGLFSHHFRGHRLQTVYGRVFAIDIIPNWRSGHRLTHGLRRLGHGIRAQVNCLLSQDCYLSCCRRSAVTPFRASSTLFPVAQVALVCWC